MKNPSQISGYWRVWLHGPDGALKQQIEGHNVITANGLEALASYLASATTSGANTFKYVGIGTGSTAEASSDTALGGELARATGTASYVSGSIWRVTATFAAGTGTGAVAEYGLFNSSSAGTMLNRDTESVVNKGASDTLTTQVDITFS
jgi:hypothetical protein